MFATERQHEIATLARAQGRVDVAALGRAFGVTTETIRQDLNRLEQVGVLRRVHPQGSRYREPPADTR
jgi:DeoR family fructose operon transcriptional repressor